MTGASNHAAAFVRFLAVGGSFALIYALLTTSLVNFAQTPPLATSVVIYAVCIPAAFLAQSRFAFPDAPKTRWALLIYAAMQVTCLSFVSAVTTRFVSYDFWVDLLLFLATSGLAAVASYLICRFFIFRAPSA